MMPTILQHAPMHLDLIATAEAFNGAGTIPAEAKEGDLYYIVFVRNGNTNNFNGELGGVSAPGSQEYNEQVSSGKGTGFRVEGHIGVFTAGQITDGTFNMNTADQQKAMQLLVFRALPHRTTQASGAVDEANEGNNAINHTVDYSAVNGPGLLIFTGISAVDKATAPDSIDLSIDERGPMAQVVSRGGDGSTRICEIDTIVVRELAFAPYQGSTTITGSMIDPDAANYAVSFVLELN